MCSGTGSVLLYSMNILEHGPEGDHQGAQTVGCSAAVYGTWRQAIKIGFVQSSGSESLGERSYSLSNSCRSKGVLGQGKT